MNVPHVKVTAHKENLSAVDPHEVLELSGMNHLLGGCKDTHKEFMFCDDIRSVAAEYGDYRMWEMKR